MYGYAVERTPCAANSFAVRVPNRLSRPIAELVALSDALLVDKFRYGDNEFPSSWQISSVRDRRLSPRAARECRKTSEAVLLHPAMVKAMATVPLSAQGFLSESSFFKKVEMLARGYLDERACKSSFVQIRREFGHHGVTIFDIGTLQLGTYLPMSKSYAG